MEDEEEEEFVFVRLFREVPIDGAFFFRFLTTVTVDIVNRD